MPDKDDNLRVDFNLGQSQNRGQRDKNSPLWCLALYTLRSEAGAWPSSWDTHVPHRSPSVPALDSQLLANVDLQVIGLLPHTRVGLSF